MINLVLLPHQFSPHEAASLPCLTAAHSVSWNRDNSRLISVTSYRAWLLQATAERLSDKNELCLRVLKLTRDTPHLSLLTVNYIFWCLVSVPRVKHLVLVTPVLAHSSLQNMWVCCKIQLEQLPSTQLRLWLSWFYTHSVLVLYTDVNTTIRSHGWVKNKWMQLKGKETDVGGWMLVVGIKVR